MAVLLRVLSFEPPGVESPLPKALESHGFLSDWHRVATLGEFEAALRRSFDLSFLHPTRIDMVSTLLDRVRRARRDLPVIAVVPAPPVETVADWMADGLADVLVGTDTAQLPAVIQRALRKGTDRAVLESAPDGFLIVGVDGRVLDVNATYCAMSGYSRDELLRMTVADLSADPPAARAVRIARTIEAGTAVHEVVHRRKDGSRLDLESNVTYDRSLARFVCFARDITERRRAQQALRESERRFRDMLDTATLLAINLDREGRVTFCNEALARLVGLPPRDVLGRNWFEHFAPGPEVSRLFADAMAQGHIVQNYDNQLVTAAGEHRWIAWNNTLLHDLDGRVTGTSSIGQDITDRRRTEETIKRSEERLRQVVQHMPVAMCAFDAAGVIVAWNEEAERITGYPAAEIVGNPRAMAMMYPDDAYRRQMFAEWDARGDDYRDWECALTCRDRTSRTVAWSNISARAPIPGWASWGIGVDVTERRRLQEQMLQMQKIESIGRLAGGIAHDFNNLLTAILGNAELALAELPPDASMRVLIEEVLAAGTRAGALTNQLLAFARKQRFRLRPLDVNDVIRDAGRMLQRLLGEDVRLDLRLAPDLGTVSGDPMHLQQVLVNLAVNARDAMPKGGVLVLETATVQATPREPGRAAGPPRREVTITVADTGVGMDPAVLAHVFEPFFTTKGVGRGTGLGLATCHGIVTQHGGRIEVASRPNVGTTFRIHLPLAEAAPTVTTAGAPPPLSTVAAAGTETVLLAEDEPSVRHLAASGLRSRGYRVIEASTGEEALARSATAPGTIEMLVTDVVMPGLSGRQLADRFLAVRPGSSVLFVSGHADEVIARHGQIPSDFLLPKPFTPEQLAGKVRELLDRRARLHLRSES